MYIYILYVFICYNILYILKLYIIIYIYDIYYILYIYLIGGFNPIKGLLVKLDHFPQSFEVKMNNMFQTTD